MWPFSRRRRPAVREVVMFTRQGCCLCETAWQTLEKAQRQFGFSLARVDVDADPALAARYGLEVPVVQADGKVFFRGLVNPVLLDRLLRGRAGP
jgi:predicted thioredoxin/glutaredoxin